MEMFSELHLPSASAKKTQVGYCNFSLHSRYSLELSIVYRFWNSIGYITHNTQHSGIIRIIVIRITIPNMVCDWFYLLFFAYFSMVPLLNSVAFVASDFVVDCMDYTMSKM